MTSTPPKASIIVPAYNVAETLAETMRALLRQTYADFELIVVDDGSSDHTFMVAASFDDPRIRILRQPNRGLAGARNTGIHAARGEYVGFCDADDLWLPEKLELHIAHFESNPDLGLSYAGSQIIDGAGRRLALRQSPKLRGICAADVLKRNPIGNGSVAVFRRKALDALAYRPFGETARDWWFDETFRQSEDIEAWLRFILTSDWRIEGLPRHLTLYRVQSRGLSTNIAAQFSTWSRMCEKIARISPDLMRRHGAAAKAYQLRYLARRAVSMRDGRTAAKLMRQATQSSLIPLLHEPVKTLVTIGAAEILNLFGAGLYVWAETRLLATQGS